MGINILLSGPSTTSKIASRAVHFHFRQGGRTPATAGLPLPSIVALHPLLKLTHSSTWERWGGSVQKGVGQKERGRFFGSMTAECGREEKGLRGVGGVIAEDRTSEKRKRRDGKTAHPAPKGAVRAPAE